MLLRIIFLALFLGGCASYSLSDIGSVLSFKNANAKTQKSSGDLDQDLGELSPQTRIADGIVTNVKVLNAKKSLAGLFGTTYRYKMEVFLDDGRVFTLKFSSKQSFFKADRIRIFYHNKVVEKVLLTYRS